MNGKKERKIKILSILTIIVLLLIVMIPLTTQADTKAIRQTGFDKGISYKPFIALQQATFVGHDQHSLLDDYAYLAAIPTSIFLDKQNDVLYAHPLLFYEDGYRYELDKERTLNARQGIDYFMEDWMGYAKGQLDHITYINVDSNEIPRTWRSKTVTSITADNPYDIAKDIALHDWEYANDAVVAVIEEEFENPDKETKGRLTGTLYPKETGKETFFVPQTNNVYSQYKEFYIPEGYKYVTARSWYPSFYLGIGLPGFENVVNMTTPAGDRDIQLYCEKDGAWMMTAVQTSWNAKSGMDDSKVSSYVHKSGPWSVGLSDVPTKAASSGLFDSRNEPAHDMKKTYFGGEVQVHRSVFGLINFGRYGTFLDIIRSLREVIYQIDINMFPGIDVSIPDKPSFGTRDVSIELSWNNPAVKLGMSLIGPAGEEILSTTDPDVSSTDSKTKVDMTIHYLGEVLPDEEYTICVFSTTDLKVPADFTISYSWKQNVSRKEGDMLSSATQGAVLASQLNSPLLYISKDTIPSATLDALFNLGVHNIHLIDIGNYVSSLARQELNRDFNVHRYTNDVDMYDTIRTHSQSNDIIFSTIQPWTSWYVGELKPDKAIPGARFIGPAAYIAAIHGAPVLFIDNHPELSSSLSWHTEFWRRHPNGYSKLPTVSEMHLTGTRVYDFLKELGLDQEGREIMITVGGQYDIGLSWDRTFVGKAEAGRFIGKPTDTSVWISRNMFYPMIIFQNPGTSPEGVPVEMGSSSARRFPWRGPLGLRITDPGGETNLKYPILNTLICYTVQFNTRASKYWGFQYQCVDGTIPGVTASHDRIDDGVMLAVSGEEGGFFPDMCDSTVLPFYLERGGYSSAYSTTFDANMHNLNQGMLLWFMSAHGASHDGGAYLFWDADGEDPESDFYSNLPKIPGTGYEQNPWRGYEWLMGSTEEPDTLTAEIHGLLPMLMGNPNPRGIRFVRTAMDYALARRPIRDILGNIASLPLLRHFTPEWFQDTQNYYDGVVGTVLVGRFGKSWYNAIHLDDALDNIHSAGVISVACFPAGNYMHLVKMRHGSPFQIIDPWATSWFSSVWTNMAARGLALGQTVGEFYTEGITKVGIQYVHDDRPVWWWDLYENVCLFGDPNLRIWTPSMEFGGNHWTVKDVAAYSYNEHRPLNIDGHTPFGATAYPHQREPVSLFEEYLWLILLLIAIIIAILVVFILRKKQKK